VEFKKWFKTLPVPFSLSFLVSTQNNGTKHVPSGFAAIRIGTDDKHTDRVHCYSDAAADNDPDHVMREVFKYVEIQDKYAQKVLSNNSSMKLSAADEQNFRDVTHCYVCHENFHEKRLVKVRDHDHLSSKEISNYRGAACNACNLALKPRHGKSRFTSEGGYFIP